MGTIFFDWIGMAFTVMHSIIALSCLHWSLTVAALMSALIMSLAPKLFNKKNGSCGSCLHPGAGKGCEQAEGFAGGL